MKIKALIAVATLTIVVGILALSQRRHLPGPAEILWRSTNRGKIVFEQESPGVDNKDFYVVSLPEFEVTLRTKDQFHKMDMFPGPRWDKEGRHFFVGGDEPNRTGLCQVDGTTGEMKLIAAWKASEPDIPVHVQSARGVGRPFGTEVSMPSFGFHDYDITIGRTTGSIFASRQFSRHGAWPSGSIGSTAQLVASMSVLDANDSVFDGSTNDKRLVVRIDSLGSDSIMFPRKEMYSFGFEISPDETTFAFGDAYATEIYNALTRKRHFLLAPEPINLRQCRFSPTDGTLAITSVPGRRWGGPGRYTLYVSRPPLYDSLEAFIDLGVPPISPPVWSPDGEWIMIQSGDKGGLFFQIVHVPTRETFRVDPDYSWKGEKLEDFGNGSRYQPGIGEFDWASSE